MKRNKGITLIALIITIIIMLILVAVSISVALNTGLFKSASDATKNWKSAQDAEANVGSEIKIGGKTYSSIEEYIKDTTPLPEIKAGDRADETSKYQTAVIPKGFTVSKIPGEITVDGGLVIYDIPAVDLENAEEDFWTKTTTVGTESYPTVQCNYNQFVWVPVETPYVTKSELDKIIADSNGNITTEQAALQSLADSGKYPMAVELANGTDYRGVLYDFSTGTNKVNISVMDFSTTANYNDGSVTYMREPAKLSSIDSSYVNQTEEQKLDLQTEYNNIVKSVKEQKGFWVARYELSYNTKGESKRGKTVANAGDSATNKWYGLYNACKTICETQNKNEMQSNMIYGSQWDQIMIWMKDVKNTNNSSKYYILDSGGMGNYNTVTGGTGSKQVSGYKTEYSVKQIFDLGGNLSDWTTEVNDTSCRDLRGLTYNPYGSSMPASDRSYYGPEFADSYSSTRATLYISL